MMAQQSMDNAFAQDVDGQDVAPEAEGQESFLYGPARLTLARGERAVVPLFELDLTGQIMVVWEPGYASHLEVSSAQPWLASVVRNTGTAPWTTGAALVTQDGRPLGQGTLSYTSKGSEAVVKVALATSVRCSLKEDQIERVEKAKTMGRTHYDKVTMQGTMEVTSTRKDVVTLRIRKDVLGKVLETSDSGKVTEKTQVPGSLVPNSTINWERQIPADGKTLSITYRYETYVVTGSNYSAE